MLSTAQAEQAIKTEAFRQVTVHTDAAYDALFKKEVQYYKVTCSGSTAECMSDPSKVSMAAVTKEQAIPEQRPRRLVRQSRQARGCNDLQA